MIAFENVKKEIVVDEFFIDKNLHILKIDLAIGNLDLSNYLD